MNKRSVEIESKTNNQIQKSNRSRVKFDII